MFIVLTLGMGIAFVGPVLSALPTHIVIDGDMSDWAGVASYADPAGDNSKPGTDILEFRIAHDETHLYFYSRHAGAIVSEDAGTGGQGRYYYLVSLDLDNDLNTGFNPATTDPECYAPAAVGCDLELEFERDWNDVLGDYVVQHFYGYGGPGTLAQNFLDLKPGGLLHFGPGNYDNKAQFKFLGTTIPDDIVFTDDIKKPSYTPGEDVFMTQAFSADMTESELCIDFRAALKDTEGHPNLAIGKTISIGFACESSPWDDCGDGMAAVNDYVVEGAPTETPTATETVTETPTSTESPTPTTTPTSTPGCESGLYLLLATGDTLRVGHPPVISGNPALNGGAKDFERAYVAQGAGIIPDLVVLDGAGVASFVEHATANISQDFLFPVNSSFPAGRAVDLQMAASSQGFWVLSDFGGIYRAGDTKEPADPALVPGTDQMGVLGYDVPFGAMRQEGVANPGGASLHAVGLIAIDFAAPFGQADGYIVIDSQGGHHQINPDGTPVAPGTYSGQPANTPLRLLEPEPGGYVWPFFPGLDIARDADLSRDFPMIAGKGFALPLAGVVVFDGWGGIHPVPVDDPASPVFFTRNEDPAHPGNLISTVGMPYLVAGFDDPNTPEDESDAATYGIDAYSIFKDFDFSVGCPSGFYTLDKFGAVHVFGDARPLPDQIFPGWPLPFIATQNAVDIELFSANEAGF
jgi:hypothetical protein